MPEVFQYFAMAETTKSTAKVCIIGAGPAGLTTLRELAISPDISYDITVYEKSSDVGGIWYFADHTHEVGGPGFLYNNLR